jgi:hypothetical protein
MLRLPAPPTSHPPESHTHHHKHTRLLPTYGQLLRQLQALGVPEVQLHEPSLATDAGAAARDVYEAAYASLAAVGCPIDLVTYYDDLGAAYPWAVNLPVAAVSLDFCGVPGDAVGNASLALVRRHGFPAGKRLGAGLIDARSPYADDLPAAAAVLAELRGLGVAHISVQPSTTLQHLPYDSASEAGHLDATLLGRLSFAVQKLASLAALASGSVAAAPADVAAAWGLPPDGSATDSAGHLPGVDAALLARPEVFTARRAKQPQFPAFPTSTIGSFPQTAEVGFGRGGARARRARHGGQRHTGIRGVERGVAWCVGRPALCMATVCVWARAFVCVCVCVCVHRHACILFVCWSPARHGRRHTAVLLGRALSICCGRRHHPHNTCTHHRVSTTPLRKGHLACQCCRPPPVTVEG